MPGGLLFTISQTSLTARPKSLLRGFPERVDKLGPGCLISTDAGVFLTVRGQDRLLVLLSLESFRLCGLDGIAADCFAYTLFDLVLISKSGETAATIHHPPDT